MNLLVRNSNLLLEDLRRLNQLKDISDPSCLADGKAKFKKLSKSR